MGTHENSHKNELEGMTVAGIHFAPLQIPMKRRLQTLAAACWILTLGMGIFLSWLTMLYIVLFTRYWWAALLYGVWIYMDKDVGDMGGRRSKWFRGCAWWRYFRDYFPLKLVKVDGAEFDPKRNYLLCAFPHGVLSTGPFGCFATDTLNFSELFPGMTAYAITLSQHFITPFIRELVVLLGGVSSSSKSINWILGSPGTGRMAVLMVGGAAESLNCHPGPYQLILKRRKGFVRLALKNGSPLVPVITFGETDIFDQVDNPAGSLLRRFQEWFRETSGVAPVLLKGRGFFQYSFGIIPKRRPVTTVVGKPIEVKKVAEPSQELVDEYHSKFIVELEKLFSSEKHKYLPNASEVDLIIQ